MNNTAPVHPANNEYIKEWLVLGPFPSNEIDTDFLCPAGGEENATSQAGDTIVTPQGASLVWQRYQTKSNIVDLQHHFRNVLSSRNAVAYLFCLLETAREETVEMHFANDGQAIVWINGKPMHRRTTDHPFILDVDCFEAVLQPGRNRCLIKVAEVEYPWPVSLRAKPLPPDRAVISDIVTNEAGAPLPDAEVILEQSANPQDKVQIIRGHTDELGRYHIHVSPVDGKYELSAMWGELGARQSDFYIRPGEQRTLNLTLKKAISISGTLLMHDDLTPHVAVPVEAIHAETSTVVATALSDEMGRYQFINLKPGRYQIRCYTGNRYAYYQSSTGERKSLNVQPARTRKGIHLRFADFKKASWKNYTRFKGLAHNYVYAIYRDSNGPVWLGTAGGLCCYDGKTFVNFTTGDGLVHNTVLSIYGTSDGTIWIGTAGGVS